MRPSSDQSTLLASRCMAHLRCEFFAESIGLSTSMTVILPQQTTRQIGMSGEVGEGPPPVLYLLHGLSDDDTIWLRRTSIERYVADRGIAVVMPAVQRSFYTDEVYGGKYWTFISEELPSLVSSFFNVSTRREDTFVAGLSMGGYGALKLALRQPERFAAAASLSGAIDVAPLTGGAPWAEDPRMWDRIFGGPDVPADDDLLSLVSRADPAALPPLWVSCGTADVLYPSNLTFAEACAAAGIPLSTTYIPGADHEWSHWDTQIERVLDWLPVREPS